MRFIPICIAVLVATISSGCMNDMRDALDERSFAWRNHFNSLTAWEQVKHCYYDVDHPHDFKGGFMAGYRAASMGGSPRPPALPPREYWSAKYASYEGQQQQVAWYNGFEHGVFAAQSSGAGEGVEIITPVKPTPLVPPKADHHVIDEDSPSPYDQNLSPDNKGSDGKPPALPPVPDYDTSIEPLPAFDGAIEVKSYDPSAETNEAKETFQPPIIKVEDDGVSVAPEQQQFSIVKNETTTPYEANPNGDLNAFFED